MTLIQRIKKTLKKSLTFIKGIFNTFKIKTKKFSPLLIRYKFQSILIILVIIFLIVFIYYFSYKYDELFDELSNREKPFYLPNIAIALAALATAVFTWWKNSLNSKTTETQENTRQDELFAKAVDFLNGENDLITRKAGVHILKDLAVKSPDHTQKCIDMLCSLNESWMPQILNLYPDFFGINQNFPNIKNLDLIKLKENPYHYYLKQDKELFEIKDDILLSQLVINTLGELFRHVEESKDHNGLYDLSYKYLCSLDLWAFSLSKINKDLSGINLQGANLNFAKLQEANLKNADLQNADLKEAVIRNADIRNANLQGADLNGADLYGASLNNANLQSTNLRGANLQDSNLRGANLQDINLRSVNLKGADFRNTQNLSNETKIIIKNGRGILTDEDFEQYLQSLS